MRRTCTRLSRFVIAVAFASPLFVAGSIARAQQGAPPAISVTGEATISMASDTATIGAGVTSTAKTAREATEANNAAMDAVLRALKAAGVAEKDFQTSRLALQPQNTNRTPSGPAQIVGYRATNHVIVTLHDVMGVASVIDTLVGAGANEIGGIAFSVSQASKLLDDARRRALADALHKAEIYAKAANVTLGAPLHISEEGAPGPSQMISRSMSADAVATPIAPGEETLRISVNVSYAIKQP